MVMCEMYPATWQEFIEEKYFRDHKEIYTNGSEIMLVSDVKKMMQHYSQERPKAQWIKKLKIHQSPYIYTHTNYSCTECGYGTNDKYNFCPNCGADMKGE